MGRQERWVSASSLRLVHLADQRCALLHGAVREDNTINSEDLAELGVPDAHEQLALIRAAVKEGNEAGGSKELQEMSSATKEEKNS
eukprot:1157614-Pelagomonas_calceolata.AAC.7